MRDITSSAGTTARRMRGSKRRPNTRCRGVLSVKAVIVREENGTVGMCGPYTGRFRRYEGDGIRASWAAPEAVDWAQPALGVSELRLRIEAAPFAALTSTSWTAICRPKLPLIPGHEIVGIVDAVGEGVDRSRLGRRVGVPWLGHTCGSCSYCASGAENLCDRPAFTGYTRDGGFATHAVADASFAFDLDPKADPVSLAPLLCAGLIGWRSLKKAGDGKRLGIYGFGAAAHIIAQVAALAGAAGLRVHASRRPHSPGLCALARRGLGGRFGRAATRTPRRRDHLCTGRRTRADGTSQPFAKVAAWYAAAST